MSHSLQARVESAHACLEAGGGEIHSRAPSNIFLPRIFYTHLINNHFLFTNNLLRIFLSCHVDIRLVDFFLSSRDSHIDGLLYFLLFIWNYWSTSYVVDGSSIIAEFSSMADSSSTKERIIWLNSYREQCRPYDMTHIWPSISRWKEGRSRRGRRTAPFIPPSATLSPSSKTSSSSCGDTASDNYQQHS